MQISTWGDLMDTLWDQGTNGNKMIPGASLEEWLGLVSHDYDEVDRLYVEHETVGAA